MIQAAINADGPASRGDTDKKELMLRKLYYMGKTSFGNLDVANADHNMFHKDFRCNFPMYNEGLATVGISGLIFWVYNAGSTTLAAGTTARIIAQLNSRWMR